MRKKINGVNKKCTRLSSKNIINAIIKCYEKSFKENLKYLKKNDLPNYRYYSHFNGAVTVNLLLKRITPNYHNPSKQNLMELIKRLRGYCCLVRSRSYFEKHSGSIISLIKQIN